MERTRVRRGGRSLGAYDQRSDRPGGVV